jgi:uncharacterized coiled-coil DUF342 family protein
MLNELDTLAENINRLIALSNRHQQARLALTQELDGARNAGAELRAELEQTRHERDHLREERDALSAKIDDAQIRLNAILEKLPHQKPSDNQLDLLAPAPNGDSAGENP